MAWMKWSENPAKNTQQLIDAWAEKIGVESINDLPVIGVGVWGDTATYGARDSLAVLLFNILGMVQRYWFCVFSKRFACACGCKGRHTFEAIFEVMKFPVECLRLGIHPHTRDDKTAFTASKYRGDARRAKRAGQKLRVKGGCVQKRGDWAWHKQVLNMCGWKGEGANTNICRWK